MSRRFDRLLESATDQTLVEPNWEQILECVDAIRGGEVNVKTALQSIQKRFHSENPHTAHHALLVLEACVKNCGKKFHNEIATKEFMEDMKNLVIENAPDKVKNKVLELIQCWASAFEKYPEYKIVCDTLSFMQMYGYEFPKLKEADAMFMADSAPDWAEGDNCFRCRVEFGMFTRKHHCRSCGQIFCDRCSSRQMILPQFGIEKKVRVCETCFSKYDRDKVKQTVEKTAGQQQQNGAPNSKAEEEARQRELQEQEELQLALAISQSEAEAKERQRGSSSLYRRDDFGSSNYSNSFNEMSKIESAPSTSEYAFIYRDAGQNAIEEDDDEIDPALSRYLDKQYWEQRQAAREATSNATLASNIEFKASAPPPSEMSFSSGGPTASDYAALANHPSQLNGNQSLQASASATPNGIAASNGFGFEASTKSFTIDQHLADLSLTPKQLPTNEMEQTVAFCDELRDQVDTMNNRMRSNLLRGRPIVNDSAIHSLFARLTAKHEEVLSRMANLDSQREHFEGLQDRLAHIQETRQALNALREEHENQRRARLEEEQRLRQQQILQKLEAVRQQKHDMLVQQRQAAMQRFQQQEYQIQQSRTSQAVPPQASIPQSMVMSQPVVMHSNTQPMMPQQHHYSSQGIQQSMPPISQPIQQPIQQVYRTPSEYEIQQPVPMQNLDFDLLNLLGTPNPPNAQPSQIYSPSQPQAPSAVSQQSNLIDFFDSNPTQNHH
ncbi:Hepatocyte growth factor-regulated tyrosine kinase substrate [Aphelenchoides besseyi]|nr:Hepatocyte growth factor-regulated tyrosine kinase substrate [Aphelenchoides besseyi]KAI6200354.1 Hepatocyte growth factor-regulated tyrosine kinase substrate [Aphelenchoides besseyi]